MAENPLLVGDLVYFANEKKPYRVKAVGGHFAICTKPYNFLKTVLYTIIDFKNEIRGPNDLVFNLYDYKSQARIDECMADLMSGEVGLSRRRQIDLDIIRIKKNLKPNE